MRAKLFLVLVLGLLAGQVRAEDATKDKLDGTWVVVTATRNGKPHDEIKGDKVTFKEGTVVVATKNKEEKATIKIDARKDPKQIDFSPEGESESLPGIFKIEGDTLKLAMVGDPGAKRPTDFTSKEGSKIMVIELKRVKK